MTQATDFKAIADALTATRDDILGRWRETVAQRAPVLDRVFTGDVLADQCRTLLDQLHNVLATGITSPAEAAAALRDPLAALSQAATDRNVTPADVAVFVFALKDALLPAVQQAVKKKAAQEAAVSAVNQLVDQMGLVTFETYTEARERVIREQQQALIETAAPVVRVWDRILMVPLIGILDSERTMLVMDRVLAGIEETQSRVVILDITGIPTVDTLVARHLIATATAVSLMGAQCIVTGISARIAQTVVQMGVDLSKLTTRATLADGLADAFAAVGLTIRGKEGA